MRLYNNKLFEENECAYHENPFAAVRTLVANNLIIITTTTINTREINLRDRNLEKKKIKLQRFL